MTWYTDKMRLSICAGLSEVTGTSSLSLIFSGFSGYEDNGGPTFDIRNVLQYEYPENIISFRIIMVCATGCMKHMELLYTLFLRYYLTHTIGKNV